MQLYPARSVDAGRVIEDAGIGCTRAAADAAEAMQRKCWLALKRQQALLFACLVRTAQTCPVPPGQLAAMRPPAPQDCRLPGKCAGKRGLMAPPAGPQQLSIKG